ncbi:MAG TPA: glycoside hydrolase family 25 protein [Chthoniobacteraceae bacterium]|jgi:lysozyme|nr:glycoside hydrolase family 25 protein [Chthoniobacteraceae bacterium]
MFRACSLLFSLFVLGAVAPRSAHAANAVLNLSHYDEMAPDFVRMRHEGIVGVIHEATYPPNTGDPRYAARQAAAVAAGHLWGAYHFANGSDPVRQADAFLNFVERHGRGISAGVLLVLDFETNTHYPGGTMTVKQAAAFVERVHARTGVYPGFYSNENRLRAAARELEADPQSRDILKRCWLWVANYHFKPAGFAPWGGWTLWQYTGDGVCDLPRGSYPKSCGNIPNAERNIFDGSEAALTQFWRARSWKVGE